MMKKIDFQKYMHHQLTEEETRQLYEWLCESKENQQAWFSLKEAWLHQEYEKEKLEADTQNEWKKFADRTGISPQTTRRRSIRTTWLYAASILLCLVIGWQAERLFTPQTESYPVIVETETGQQAKVKLPDGSSVWLNACSTLSYTTGNWKKERNVTLHGEAIFDVKSQNGPFPTIEYTLSHTFSAFWQTLLIVSGCSNIQLFMVCFILCMPPNSCIFLYFIFLPVCPALRFFLKQN